MRGSSSRVYLWWVFWMWEMSSARDSFCQSRTGCWARAAWSAISSESITSFIERLATRQASSRDLLPPQQ